MPLISNAGSYAHFHYSYLGNNFTDAFIHLISHPIDSVKVLFTNHTNDTHGDFVKMELHVLLVTSGILFLIKKPQYILMLLPIYFQKLFHDNYSMWGIGGQYSIEFAPIMTIGIFLTISELNSKRLIKYLSLFVLLLATASTIKTMVNTVYYTDKIRIRFYEKSHYQNSYDVSNVHKQLSKIPKHVVVSSQSPFLPHLSLRDNIYQFPIIKDAEYIVYSDKENPYPMTQDEFESAINELEHSKDWEVFYKKDITILKKISL